MQVKWNPENAQEVLDTLVGSGASQYEWYRELDDSDGVVTVVMETGDHTPEGRRIVRRRRFNTEFLVSLVNDIIAEKRSGWSEVRLAVIDDDFDSVQADIVFQHAVLGDWLFA